MENHNVMKAQVYPIGTEPFKKKKRSWTKSRIQLLLIAFPFLAFILLFNYVPLFGWLYAFYDYRPGLPLFDSDFVGIKYFLLLFDDGGELKDVLRNTLILSVLGLLSSPLGIAFAVFLMEIRSKWFRKLVQTTTTLPNFISWILVFSVFFTFLSVDDGVINRLFMKLHWIDEPINYLGSSGMAWVLQTLIGIWKGLGFGAIIYIAAIAGIDQELYDAAKVDGAGRYKSIWHITLPGIMPTFFVLTLLGIGNFLSNGFEQYYVFYNSLVADKLDVLDYYVYRIGLENADYSFSTAIGMFKTLVSVILLFSFNAIAKRIRGDSIF